VWLQWQNPADTGGTAHAMLFPSRMESTNANAIVQLEGLGTTLFTTNFHPGDFGILDAVAQVLSLKQGKGLRADLGKLNVRMGDKIPHGVIVLKMCDRFIHPHGHASLLTRPIARHSC
jgi:hypothetical protein